MSIIDELIVEYKSPKELINNWELINFPQILSLETLEFVCGSQLNPND